MGRKPASIDEYLASLSADQQAALERIRNAIRAAAPRAEECISYQLPAFRLDGRMLVGFGATANHCAFYPMSSTTVSAHQKELADYVTSKGTIRFQPDRSLPATLIRKLVTARIAENAAVTRKSKSGRAPSSRMNSRPRFSATTRRALSDAKIVGIRAGSEHRFTGVWVVVVEARAFVRSWNDKPTGWYRAFGEEPRGSLQVAGEQMPIRGRPVKSERMRGAVSKAFADKYDTKASQQWVRGFAQRRRALTTLELLPL